MGPITDHLSKDLLILFIGYNPSIRSWETGHHYANPTNRFWKAIYLAGLTPRLYRPEEDSEVLRLGYGFTNIVARPTIAADEISKEEYRAGRVELRHKIEQYRPKVACFVGKGVYEQYSGKRKIGWGQQLDPVTPGVVEFVCPSTSGLVRMKLDEMVGIFSGLTAFIVK
ncbi:mismatch-specific DNA-glycosylase [Paenibacillus sp. GP183]|uniref:mismatch-specific DNA-glycosylase n=1 Tax=Paenibacillus sp. GP183 TaxID=1882751 RepID=UPI000B892557|nr:mismatch-specific DNA-glycosylase [Paenibacillus sp. GP183]